MPLSDTALKSLKPQARPYERADEKGLFVEVLPTGAIAFRYRYRLNGKREKVSFGVYPDVSLKRARKLHAEARVLVAAGKSPARQKQADKREDASAESFKEFAELWKAENGSGERWRSDQTKWLERDIYPAIGSRPLKEVTPDDVLTLLDSIKKDRDAPQSALRVRGIIKQVYDYAIARQRATFNPAGVIPSKIIAKPQSRDRTLSTAEIRRFLDALDASNADKSNKIALRLIFLTMVRKGELRKARWQDVDLDNGEWTIPETKNGRQHVVYLSKQAARLFTDLKRMAGKSEWVLPQSSDPKKPAGETTLNSILYSIELAQRRAKVDWESFTVHDLRRTASTLLHEQGFNTDVIEKALNHTMRGVRGVYNRAEYADQRKEMLQHWADFLDGLESGAKVTPFRKRA